MVNPIGEEYFHISSSQEHLLSHSIFAREDQSTPRPCHSPKSSSSSSGLLSDDVVGITICSVPDTPDPSDVNDDSTPHLENFETPPEHPTPVVEPSRLADDLHLGFSADRKTDDVEASGRTPPLAKKSKASELGLPKSSRRVELGASEANSEMESLSNSNKIESVEACEPTPPLAKKLKASELGFPKSSRRVEFDAEETNSELKSGVVSVSNSDSDAMKCLMDVLRDFATENGNDRKDHGAPVDILETAMRRGITFPRSRFYD